MTTWRFLEDDGAGAVGGLATDEALLARHDRIGAAEAGGATLRLYTYRPHCALVGRYQSLDDEVDLDRCSSVDVDVGRRPTGGGAIIMGPDQLGVAVAARATPERTPRELLGRYAEGVISGLAELGVRASFRSKNDLEVDDRKIAGLGLYLDPNGAVLFHASVLVDLDVALMLKVLRIPGVKFADKANVRRVSDRVTTVCRELDRPIETREVRAAIRAGFARAFGVELESGELDAAEQSRRDRLIDERYGDDAWIHQRSPRRDARGSALLKTPAGLLRIYVATHGDTIKSALVTGDFNLLPPAVGRLEAALRWCRATQDRIRESAAETLDGELGVPAEAVADAIWQATESALRLEREGHPARLEGSCYFPEPGAPPSGITPNPMTQGNGEAT